MLVVVLYASRSSYGRTSPSWYAIVSYMAKWHQFFICFSRFSRRDIIFEASIDVRQGCSALFDG